MVLDQYIPKTVEWWKPQPPQDFKLTEELTKLWQQQQLNEKIKELEELLQRAREYDKRNNEPDCELSEKKETLRTLAKQLGVEIRFLDGEENA